jgi:hypothetical protein
MNQQRSDCRLIEQQAGSLRTHLDAMAHRQADSDVHVVGADCLGLDLRIGGQPERLMLENPIPTLQPLLQELASRLLERLS